MFGTLSHIETQYPETAHSSYWKESTMVVSQEYSLFNNGQDGMEQQHLASNSGQQVTAEVPIDTHTTEMVRQDRHI